jgi:N-methylhydantoinase B
MDSLLAYSERLMRAELRQMPAGRYAAEDVLDDDGIGEAPIRLRVAITLDPRRARAVVDFSGSDPQVAGSVNAVAAITYSATFYVFRCLLPEEAAPTAGLMRPVRVIVPPGSVLDARPPAAVAGGNVECSQRIVDVLLRALAAALPSRIPAASSGTMNNLTIGGLDPRTGRAYAYYETCGGGMGAAPDNDGLSGVHTHMSNTLNTPIEALEYAYPFRVRRYAYRRGSGGAGQRRGGDGLIRELELLAPAQVTLLAERRRFAPYGLQGGGDGACGRTILQSNGETRELPGKCNVFVPAGAVIRLESPGGGGWGKPKP